MVGRDRGASGPERGTAYPRIRAVLLTYWFSRADGLPGQRHEQPGAGGGLSADKGSTADLLVQPGGRFAGAEARTARRGGGLSADNVSTADILARQWPTCPARRLRRAAPAPPHGGRFAPAGPGAAFRTGRVFIPARGAAYPRIRAVLLTYLPGPGGRLAGTEA